jgi:cell division protein ZapA
VYSVFEPIVICSVEDLSIKIKIADREYPMKVKRHDEERVRTAGRLINEKLKTYKEQFGIDDKQDLLAMVAFDCLVDKMTVEESRQEIDQTVFEKVNQLNQLVSQSIL